MEWWMWISLGLLLMVLELATPSGFYIMFFGLGAVTVGLLARMHLLGPAWVEWLLFTVSSLAYVLVFRDRLRHRIQRPERIVDSLVGDLAIPRERIVPGAVGGVEVRGAQWRARNESSAPVEPGQRCRVVNVDGLMVGIAPE